MQNLNVPNMDTRDSNGRGRFFPFVPDSVYFPGKMTPDYWYWKNIYYPPAEVTVPYHLLLLSLLKKLNSISNC